MAPVAPTPDEEKVVVSQITVIGGTGYAGSAVVEQAAARGHQVVALSQHPPSAPVPGVSYVQGDAADEGVLASVITGADAVVAALAPRGALTPRFRDINRAIAQQADAAAARLVVVGGFSSLRPAPGAPRFVADLSDVPSALHEEVLSGAALITEDLPAAPASLDWIFVSPARAFGAFAPGEAVGRYQLGDDVAVEPVTGGQISAADYALGLVDLLADRSRSRVQVNLGNPV